MQVKSKEILLQKTLVRFLGQSSAPSLNQSVQTNSGTLSPSRLEATGY